MSNYGAPVCNVTPPGAPLVTPTVAIPAIPVATDLPSALSAIRALRTAVLQMNGQSGSAISVIAGQDPRKPKKDLPAAAFAETSRIVKTVKVTNPKDHSQYVMVKQIVGLKFKNPKTNQTIDWAQDSPGATQTVPENVKVRG